MKDKKEVVGGIMKSWEKKGKGIGKREKGVGDGD